MMSALLLEGPPVRRLRRPRCKHRAIQSGRVVHWQGAEADPGGMRVWVGGFGIADHGGEGGETEKGGEEWPVGACALVLGALAQAERRGDDDGDAAHDEGEAVLENEGEWSEYVGVGGIGLPLPGRRWWFLYRRFW